MDRLEDERGFFARSLLRGGICGARLADRMPQCSVSFNPRRGTLRGMHYQAAPHAEDKLVRCTAGRDISMSSSICARTRRRCAAGSAPSSRAENRRSLFVPKGFAHGFITLRDDTEVLYMISVPYVAGLRARRALERSGHRHLVGRSRPRSFRRATRPIRCSGPRAREREPASAGDGSGRASSAARASSRCAPRATRCMRVLSPRRTSAIVRAPCSPEVEMHACRPHRSGRGRCAPRGGEADAFAAFRLDRDTRPLLAERGELSMAEPRRRHLLACFRPLRRRPRRDGRQLRGIRLVARRCVQRALEPARRRGGERRRLMPHARSPCNARSRSTGARTVCRRLGAGYFSSTGPASIAIGWWRR